MFANSQGMGMDFAMPDICKTPTPGGPVPIPYPNIGLGPTALAFFPKLLWVCMPAHNLATTIPLTNGDNPGVLLGVVFPAVMGPSRHITAAFKVLLGGIPATRLACKTKQNGLNADGARVLPSQFKVMILAG